MYEPVIGLEIHCELKTRTKMFCGCLNDPEERRPNVNACPVCMGHPGTLPAPNEEAVKEVMRLGLAIGGKLAERSHFDRKSYFYPDLPKGYQISQYDEPFVEHGSLNGVRVKRVHLEEDAGRLSHTLDGKTDKEASYVDYNRAGMPLMELVTEPDIRSGEEAVAFARSLQRILRYIGASNADMEHGQMRIEVNISLKDKDSAEFGTKVEVKNINSFKAVQGAIECEIKRQTELLEKGERITHETRGWNDAKGTTESQRSKEEAHDYRYFPEPDIPPMTFTPDFFEALQDTLPELPEQKRLRFIREYGISEAQADVLCEDLFWADYFEAAASELGTRADKPDYGLLINYLTSDLWGAIKARGEEEKTSELKATPQHFATLVSLIQSGKCSSRMAKDILAKMLALGDDPEEIMQSEGLSLISDDSAILEIVREVIEKNAKAVGEYKAGKENALQFLVGQGMAKSKGQADPNKLRELFAKELA